MIRGEVTHLQMRAEMLFGFAQWPEDCTIMAEAKAIISQQTQKITLSICNKIV